MFTLIAVLLMVAASFLIVDGGLRLRACVRADILSLEPWKTEFWLLPPIPRGGLAPNAKWFMRVAGGFLAFGMGFAILRAASR